MSRPLALILSRDRALPRSRIQRLRNGGTPATIHHSARQPVESHPWHHEDKGFNVFRASALANATTAMVLATGHYNDPGIIERTPSAFDSYWSSRAGTAARLNAPLPSLVDRVCVPVVALFVHGVSSRALPQGDEPLDAEPVDAVASNGLLPCAEGLQRPPGRLDVRAPLAQRATRASGASARSTLLQPSPAVAFLGYAKVRELMMDVLREAGTPSLQRVNRRLRRRRARSAWQRRRAACVIASTCASLPSMACWKSSAQGRHWPDAPGQSGGFQGIEDGFEDGAQAWLTPNSSTFPTAAGTWRSTRRRCWP